MSFLDIVSKFNQQADSHSQSQSLNPFSEQFEQSRRSPSPRFSREEYGKPVAGSKTDLRGRKAKSHVCREILELCTVIHDVGTYNSKKKDDDDDDDDGEGDEANDGTIIVSFGELFQIYTKISDKVVGLLIAAKRRGFVYFDREILFQRRDDDVLIALLKPVSEISKILKEDIDQATAPAPVEPKPVEKPNTASSNKTKRVKAACKLLTFCKEEQNGVDGGAAVDADANETNYCNEQVDGVVDKEVMNNVIDISESTEDDDDDDDDGSIRVDTSVEDVSRDEIDYIKTDEMNETKPDGTRNETKTDETETREIDDINTEQVDDSNDGLIANKSENCDLAGRLDGEQVPDIDEVENGQNEKRVEVDESSANDDRVIGRKQNVEEVQYK